MLVGIDATDAVLTFARDLEYTGDAVVSVCATQDKHPRSFIVRRTKNYPAPRIVSEVEPK
jgi:hypothetical protein